MQRSQVASPKTSALDFGDETLDLSKVNWSLVDWSQVKWPSDMSRLSRLNWNTANWTTVDLSHTSGSDGEFSSFWHRSGSPMAWDIKDYPQWNAMCGTLLYEFDHEHFMKIPSELAMLYDLASGSALCDVTSRSYLANNDPGDCRSVEIKKRDIKEIHKEMEIWTLDSLLKVLRQYVALHLFRSRYTDSRTWIDIQVLQNSLIDTFAIQLVSGFINPIAERIRRNVLFVDIHKTDIFAKMFREEVNKLLYMLGHGRQDAVFRFAVTGNIREFFDQYQLQKRIDDLKAEADAAAKAAVEAAAKAAAEAAVKTTLDAVRAAQTVETVEAAETAAISVAEIEAASASTPTSTSSPLPVSTPVPTLITAPPAASMSTDSRPKSKRSLVTVALLAIGAIAGVVALGIVIAATHGVALPFIAGIGATILVGHGGVAAGLAVGCSLFGSAAAAVGACIAYAAKKTYDFVNWCCCGKQSESDMRDSHAHIERAQVGRSRNTTPLLDAAMSNKQHDYKSTQFPRKEEVLHHLPGNASPRDNQPVSSRFGWANFFCCAGDATQQQSVVSEPQYQQRLGHLL